MTHIYLQTPDEIRLGIAQRAKTRRLVQNISQKELAERSGVRLRSLQTFEKTGHISLVSLLMLAFALRMSEEFGALFAEPQAPASLFISAKPQRKRARKTYGK